jgi:hypothetical protein
VSTRVEPKIGHPIARESLDQAEGIVPPQVLPGLASSFAEPASMASSSSSPVRAEVGYAVDPEYMRTRAIDRSWIRLLLAMAVADETLLD